MTSEQGKALFEGLGPAGMPTEPAAAAIYLLVVFGYAGVQAIRDRWQLAGLKDEDLDPIIADLDRRIARRS